MMIKGAMKVKTILVIVILLLVGVLGVVGMGAVRTYMSGASASEGPKGVTVSVSNDGKTAIISFTTDKKSQGTIKYGLTPTNTMLSKSEESEGTDHSIELSSLKLNSTYYYSIDIAGTDWNNAGIPYSFSTTVKEDVSTPTNTPIPTVAVSSGSSSSSTTECKADTDYNQDGKVNSLDYRDCMKAKTDKCAGKDFNNDGVINSLDLIKCGQSDNK